MRGRWKLFAYIVVLMMAFNMFSHGSQDLYPTFLKQQLHFDTRTVGTLTVVLNLGAIVGGLFFGAWSREGRPPPRDHHRGAARDADDSAVGLRRLGRACSASACSCCRSMVQGAWGVVPVHLNELSPDAVRGTLPGFAYQGGNLLASVTAPLLTQVRRGARQRLCVRDVGLHRVRRGVPRARDRVRPRSARCAVRRAAPRDGQGHDGPARSW